MSFITHLERKEQAEVEKATATYRDLLTRDIGGKLSAEDRGKLERAVGRLGLTVEQVKGDLAILARFKALAGAPEELAAAQAERKALDAEQADLASEQEAALRGFAERGRELAGRDIDSLGRQSNAARLAADRSELAAAHWKLLGLPDPAIAGRRRHLHAAAFAEAADPKAEHHVIAVEQIMQAAQARSHGDLDRLDFVPMPGQSKAELTRLLAIARSIYLACRPGEPRQTPSYLLSKADLSRVKRSENLVLWAEDVAADPQFNAGGALFVPAPWQSDSDLIELAERATAKAVSRLRRLERDVPELKFATVEKPPVAVAEADEQPADDQPAEPTLSLGAA
jgi:hypothetical protein